MRLFQVGDNTAMSKALTLEGVRVCFAIKLVETADYDREWAEQVGKYHVTLYAVSADAVGEEACRQVVESVGIDPEDISPATRHLALLECGVVAPLWKDGGNNKNKLMRSARRALRDARENFGDYMDRPVNRAGTTGWEAIRGEV